MTALEAARLVLDEQNITGCFICENRYDELHHFVKRQHRKQIGLVADLLYVSLVPLCVSCHKRAHEGNETQHVKDAIKHRLVNTTVEENIARQRHVGIMLNQNVMDADYKEIAKRSKNHEEKLARSRQQQNLYWKWMEAIFTHVPERITSAYRSPVAIHELIKGCYCQEVAPELWETKVRYVNGKFVPVEVPFSTALDRLSQKRMNSFMNYVEEWCSRVIGIPLDKLLEEKRKEA